MARVTIEDLEVAREWLLVNEGDEGEMESCQRVAAWIEHELDERQVRSAAQKAGVTLAIARKAIAQLKHKASVARLHKNLRT